MFTFPQGRYIELYINILFSSLNESISSEQDLDMSVEESADGTDNVRRARTSVSEMPGRMPGRRITRESRAVGKSSK